MMYKPKSYSHILGYFSGIFLGSFGPSLPSNDHVGIEIFNHDTAIRPPTQKIKVLTGEKGVDLVV